MATPSEVAAIIHADMCADDRNGYSWAERWGNPATPKTLTIDGLDYTYNLGDYDCSSSVITSCRQAVRHTPHEGCFDAAQSTHSMRNVFMASGLFDLWDTAATIARRGDVYLHDENHTAMCQSADPDILSEFSINEFGEVYGGQRGDQTGTEAYTHGYYPFALVTLHWRDGAEAPAPAPRPEPDSSQVRYRAWVGGAWLDPMVGRVDTGYSGDDYAGILGRPMGYLAIEGAGRYRVCSQASGWLPWVDSYDPDDLENGCAGDGSPIIAIEIPDKGFRYAAHDMASGWHEPMVGNTDTGGTGETYAGDMKPIDGFWLERV